MSDKVYTVQDYKSGQPRWCPGCGDHAFLNSLHKAMAELGTAPHDIAVISGIGCSSRLPYYVNTYGFHTIHGRAAAVATGAKVANPKLTVWQISGDGDGLAIGGNHFIHALRRNIDLNMILLNNRIYGLTKGQYSPTSARGIVTKSSPYGTVEDPFRPAELTIGARGRFFARTIDVDMKNSPEIMLQAAKHKGTSVVEVLLNCVIFNDGIYDNIVKKEFRSDRTIFLRHGEKMLFGTDNDKGIVRDGFNLKAVNLNDGLYSLDDVLVHDTHEEDPSLHLKLALMDGSDLPVALGVIRDVAAPVYDEEVDRQIAEVRQRKPFRSLMDFLKAGETWRVDN